MGITCKPFGKNKPIFVKMENEKAKKENAVKKSAKTSKSDK